MKIIKETLIAQIPWANFVATLSQREEYFFSDLISFALAPMSTAAPIQQTYQMFMPNKIKKGRDFKINHDLANKKESNSQSAVQLQQMIKNIMPQSVQNAQRQVSHYQDQKQFIYPDEIYTDPDIFQTKDETDQYEDSLGGRGFQIQSLKNKQPSQTLSYFTPLIKQQSQQSLNNVVDQNSYISTNPINQFTTNRSINRLSFSNEKRRSQNDSMSSKTKRDELYIGKKQEMPIHQSKQLSNVEQLKMALSPLGDQKQQSSDMVYLGGFLLKPRTKLATFQDPKKKQQGDHVPNLEDDKQDKLIKVKSLDKIVKQRKNRHLRTIDAENDLDLVAFSSLNAKDRLNYIKTVKFLKNINQERPPSNPPANFEHSVQESSIKGSLSSHRFADPALDIDSPQTLYPVQKILITHKDSSVDSIDSNDNSSKKKRKNRKVRQSPLRSKKHLQAAPPLLILNCEKILPKQKTQRHEPPKLNNDIMDQLDQNDTPSNDSSFHIPQWNETPMLSDRTIQIMQQIHKQKYGPSNHNRLNHLQYTPMNQPSIQMLPQYSQGSASNNINAYVHTNEEFTRRKKSKKKEKDNQPKMELEKLTPW
ncbi:UNKNOWN [Stylonychia lemnae]|uniref:Uncharacterized protein n=1 Tax=Stylonychia lemnae TaxID=5949 RepID=A0A078AC87_STYLE|nr:UNKNOWN [Stylonychia lemnae]|eukprot:CDW78408.1 UNKNOWN [Stylonychia lemnae]